MRRAIGFVGALTTIGAVLLAGELLLRVFGEELLPSFFRSVVTKGGVRTYGLRPDASQTYSHLGRTVQVTVGSDGWRHTAETAGDTRRTLHIIGDSQVFGWGLSDAETIPFRLQARLGKEVRIANRGLPGAGPNDYLRELYEVPDGDDVIVVFTEANDLQDTYSPLPVAQEHCGFIVVPGGLAERMPCGLLHSRLYGGLTDLYQAFADDGVPVPLCYNPHLRAACQLAMYRAQERLAEAARRRKGKTLFLTVPWEALLDASALANYVPRLTAPPVQYSANSLPHHALVMSRLAPLSGRAFLKDDHHLSPAGAQAIADLMLDLLTDGGRVR